MIRLLCWPLKRYSFFDWFQDYWFGPHSFHCFTLSHISIVSRHSKQLFGQIKLWFSKPTVHSLQHQMTHRQSQQLTGKHSGVLRSWRARFFPSGVSGELNKAKKSVSSGLLDCNRFITEFVTLGRDRLFPTVSRLGAKQCKLCGYKHDSKRILIFIVYVWIRLLAHSSYQNDKSISVAKKISWCWA